MYNAFARVEVLPRERYVPASLEARLAVYAVSPSASELRPYLEGDIREAWVEHGCNQHQYSADPSLLPPTCDDYYVGWFPWPCVKRWSKPDTQDRRRKLSSSWPESPMRLMPHVAPGT